MDEKFSCGQIFKCFCKYMVIQSVIVAGLLCVGLARAATITFDLRNLGAANNHSFNLLQDGLELRFSPIYGGQVVSTAWGIGIDSDYTGEVSGFINGNVQYQAKSESMFFLFSENVLIQSITLFWNSPGVVPIIEPKSVISQSTVLGSGTTQLPDLVVRGTSANTIRHSSTGFFPAGGGFAIQSITVATVPEPTTMFLAALGTIASLACRGTRK
jgi:hypothetical protein